MSNIIATEQRERAVRELRMRFGRHFDDILAKTGVDMGGIISKASNNLISRVAHEKEFIISGSMFLPPHVHIPEGSLFSVRFVSLSQEPGGWNWSYYPVAKDLSRERMKEGEDLIIRTRAGQVFHFPGGGEVAERWRICGTGFIQNGTLSMDKVNLATAVLYTPAKWSDYCAVGRSVRKIDKRLRKLTGLLTRTELSFRSISESGFSDKRVGGFRLSENENEFDKQIQILSLGGQVRLTNEDGVNTCVRYDCSENCLTESLPYDIALKLNTKRNETERREQLKKKNETSRAQSNTVNANLRHGRQR